MCQICFDKYVAHTDCDLCHGIGWLLTQSASKGVGGFGRCVRCNPVKSKKKRLVL